jgi:hypothetical protein
MKPLIVLFALGIAVELHAAPNAKELVKEAQKLEQAAAAESNPQKATEIRRSSCDKWQEAYNAEKKPDYLLSIGLCRVKVQESDAAETAFRSFLVEAPAGHMGRSAAEQAIERIIAERTAKEEKTPQALVITEPLPTEETPKQWKRRAIFAGSSLAGLGLIGGAIAFGVIRAQEEPTAIPIGQGGTAVEIP